MEETAAKHLTQERHFINAHKILTPVVVLGMMAYYEFWGTLAWVYLALHGTYCVLWIVKEHAFRDRRFEKGIHPVAGLIFIFGALGAYWIAPYLIIANRLEGPNWLIALSVSTTMLGIFYHYVSDAYKHAILSREKGLITTGLFANTRNPNYFGEMLIYAGFAILAQSWIVLLPLAYWWSFFVVNMIRKDKSISRYPEFAEWKKKTFLFIPRII